MVAVGSEIQSRTPKASLLRKKEHTFQRTNLIWALCLNEFTVLLCGEDFADIHKFMHFVQMSLQQ